MTDKETNNLKNAHKNFESILNNKKKSTNKKFEYLDNWLYKKSNLLLREINKPRTFFTKYKRGTILKVDFGVNIGSEFSQVHYAIVLNKDDSRKNHVLTVIPLTSKDKKNTINIGNIIFNKFMETAHENLEKNQKAIESVDENDEVAIKNLKKEIDKLTKVINYYVSNPVCSYACCKNITTINKTRIVNAINEYDFINKAVCDQETMDKLDKNIVEIYTNINIDK